MLVTALSIGAAAQQAPHADTTPPPAAVSPGPASPMTQAPQITSPEVSSDGHITFRIWAPQVHAIGLRANDIPGLATPESVPAFTKGDDGVWQVTVGPVAPGAYRYTFVVDGVPSVDPRNPQVSESNSNVWSLVVVPGSDVFDIKNVPHGAVASIEYYSTALSKFRRMHVYTPPGYETSSQSYPIFYLLHGAGDSDDSWTSVGRAGYILDNLIAANKVKPMVVVMPAGHTSQFFFGGRRPVAAGTPPRRDEFLDDFVTDIMPYAEKHYRVLADRSHRAIAGLSMGGGQTLNIAFSHLDDFAYIGVFSSGILGNNTTPEAWETSHQATLDNASLKQGVKLLWFSTGVDDRLITNSRNTVELLKKHGFDAVFKSSPGAHTWINWRNYLAEFAPQLFQ